MWKYLYWAMGPIMLGLHKCTIFAEMCRIFSSEILHNGYGSENVCLSQKCKKHLKKFSIQVYDNRVYGKAVASSMGFFWSQVTHSFFIFETQFSSFLRDKFLFQTVATLQIARWSPWVGSFSPLAPASLRFIVFTVFTFPVSRLYCAVKVSLGRKYLRNNNVIFAYLYLFRVSDSKRGTFIFAEILQVFSFFFFSNLDLVNILLRITTFAVEVKHNVLWMK